MNPRDTGRQYDAIASEWDESRRASRQGVDCLERAVALVSRKGRALDVGCGSGGVMIETLLASGFAVTGIDVSTRLLDLAARKYPTVEFVHGDIAEWETTTRFDLVVAWDSIFHLPRNMHVPVIEKLLAHLTPGGALLFTAGGIDSEIMGTMHGREFYYSSLAETALLEAIKRAGGVPVLMERDQYPQHHLVIIAAKVKVPAPDR
jgi:2-polyprenyl-3-methyl-5-hydroxy-6-metoxy-1,4-benzoquinol methylase